MKEEQEEDSVLNRWRGFEDVYDRYRPEPPEALLDTLSEMVGEGIPKLVVDLGAGTGISTRVWADRAVSVIGIEPSCAMFAAALVNPSHANVSYRNVFAEDTGLADGSVDIATASSSLHWLHPGRATSEIARILRPGGVFCGFGVRNPVPLRCLSLERSIFQLRQRWNELVEDHEAKEEGRRWKWNEYSEAMSTSHNFSEVREIWLHSILGWDSGDLANWLRSLVSYSKLTAMGLSDEELGLGDLCRQVFSEVGEGKTAWLFQWKLLVGVRR